LITKSSCGDALVDVAVSRDKSSLFDKEHRLAPHPRQSMATIAHASAMSFSGTTPDEAAAIQMQKALLRQQAIAHARAAQQIAGLPTFAMKPASSYRRSNNLFVLEEESTDDEAGMSDDEASSFGGSWDLNFWKKEEEMAQALKSMPESVMEEDDEETTASSRSTDSLKADEVVKTQSNRPKDAEKMKSQKEAKKVPQLSRKESKGESKSKREEPVPDPRARCLSTTPQPSKPKKGEKGYQDASARVVPPDAAARVAAMNPALWRQGLSPWAAFAGRDAPTDKPIMPLAAVSSASMPPPPGLPLPPPTVDSKAPGLTPLTEIDDAALIKMLHAPRQSVDACSTDGKTRKSSKRSTAAAPAPTEQQRPHAR